MISEQKHDLRQLFARLRYEASNRRFEFLDQLASKYVDRAIQGSPTDWTDWRAYNLRFMDREPTLRFVVDAVGSQLKRRGIMPDCPVNPWYERLIGLPEMHRGKHWQFNDSWLEEIERQAKAEADGESLLQDTIMEVFDEATNEDRIRIDREFWAEWYSMQYKHQVGRDKPIDRPIESHQPKNDLDRFFEA